LGHLFALQEELEIGFHDETVKAQPVAQLIIQVFIIAAPVFVLEPPCVLYGWLISYSPFALKRLL